MSVEGIGRRKLRPIQLLDTFKIGVRNVCREQLMSTRTISNGVIQRESQTCQRDLKYSRSSIYIDNSGNG